MDVGQVFLHFPKFLVLIVLLFLTFFLLPTPIWDRKTISDANCRALNREREVIKRRKSGQRPTGRPNERMGRISNRRTSVRWAVIPRTVFFWKKNTKDRRPIYSNNSMDSDGGKTKLFSNPRFSFLSICGVWHSSLLPSSYTNNEAIGISVPIFSPSILFFFYFLWRLWEKEAFSRHFFPRTWPAVAASAAQKQKKYFFLSFLRACETSFF